MDVISGLKISQRQEYDAAGKRWPVTVVKLDKSDQLDKLAVGDKIKVTGQSKGKGFQGVVRRHGFKGGPKTHGQSNRQRHPGAIGSGTTPGRVYKGKKMAGHMGNVQATIRNLLVFAVKPEENQLLIRGLVPGGRNSLVKIVKI